MTEAIVSNRSDESKKMEGELIEVFRVLPFDQQQLYGGLIIHRADHVKKMHLKGKRIRSLKEIMKDTGIDLLPDGTLSGF